MNLYGIFYGSKWALGYNKRKAMTLAKANGGSVRYIPGGATGYGQPNSWDAPTFRVSSLLLHDFSNS